MISLSMVKTLLGITSTDYDTQLNVMIPMVSSDVRRMLNNQYNERIDCSYESGATEITGLYNVRSFSSIENRFHAYSEYRVTNKVEIGRVVTGNGIPDDTYITAYDGETGVATISQATTDSGTEIITSVLYGMLPTIARMVWFKVGKMTTTGDDREIASKNIGVLSVTYADSAVDKKWGYPINLIRDLGTPIARVM